MTKEGGKMTVESGPGKEGRSRGEWKWSGDVERSEGWEKEGENGKKDFME